MKIRYVSLFIITLAAALTLLILPLHWPPGGDAPHYIAASTALMNGQGWQLAPSETARANPHYTDWPPLYPMVLAVLRSIGLDAYTAARALNIACLAALMLMLWHALPAGRKALTFALLTPVPIWVYVLALSEPLFNVLVFAFLLLLTRKPLPLAALSIVAALAWLTRYVGMYAVAFGAVYILWQWGWRQALAFAVLPVVCMAGWVIRNVDLIGLPFGTRPPPEIAAAANIESALLTLVIFGLSMGVVWLISRLSNWFLSLATSRS